MTSQDGIQRSIVIAHLNQPRELARCLASLAPQIAAHPGTEVIVVDNGSRQLPSDVCAAHAFARLEQEAEAGPGPARNRGVAVARSDLLLFIDADCIAHDDWLRAAVAHFAGDPAATVIGGDVRIHRADATRPTALEAYESVFGYRQAEYIQRMGFSATLNMAVTRATFQRVGPFAGIGIAEDRDWGRRATALGYRITYVPQMIVHHPARQSFAELRRKWDRHISHDYAESGSGLVAAIRWLFLALAVAASGVIDIRKVVGSRRVATLRERLLASATLCRIRLYRFGRMLACMVPSAHERSRDWNRHQP